LDLQHIHNKSKKDYTIHKPYTINLKRTTPYTRPYTINLKRITPYTNIRVVLLLVLVYSLCMYLCMCIYIVYVLVYRVIFVYGLCMGYSNRSVTEKSGEVAGICRRQIGTEDNRHGWLSCNTSAQAPQQPPMHSINCPYAPR
jgi:hypothetical protein